MNQARNPPDLGGGGQIWAVVVGRGWNGQRKGTGCCDEAVKLVVHCGGVAGSAQAGAAAPAGDGVAAGEGAAAAEGGAWFVTSSVVLCG